MVKILKGNGSSEEIYKIDKLDYYNNIIDFKSLRSEILSWNKTLDYFKNSNGVKFNSILSISKLFHENKLAKDFIKSKIYEFILPYLYHLLLPNVHFPL